MKSKTIIFGLLLLLLSACNKPIGELVGGAGHRSFKEANPHGMSYIKGGTFLMGSNDESILGNASETPINVSVDAFWMDQTEITNEQYKQFVYWVRDSIARRAFVLAGRDEFRMKNSEDVAPEIAPLNWKTRIPWNSKDEEMQDILSILFEGDAFGESVKGLNTTRLHYQYEWVNYDQAALLGNRYNPNTGSYPEGASVSVDTSYVDENGAIKYQTIKRKLRTKRDLVSRQIVSIYPDTLTWIGDFQNTYNDPRMLMYFSHKGFSQYPVVGVSWNQAQAFCRWRTVLFNSTHQIKSQDYRLPTEAEWEYAARGGRKSAMYPWGGSQTRDKNGCYMANFKPSAGGYAGDDGTTTMKVASFSPNDYGLYDMSGNVAEWTSSAYISVSNRLVFDMNPNYQHNAKISDPVVLKRKVVKGGSWKDVSYYLQCGSKTYEYQDECRPYIGFRCVRSYSGN